MQPLVHVTIATILIAFSIATIAVVALLVRRAGLLSARRL